MRLHARPPQHRPNRFHPAPDLSTQYSSAPIAADILTVATTKTGTMMDDLKLPADNHEAVRFQAS
jgi:hypothetical protein